MDAKLENFIQSFKTDRLGDERKLLRPVVNLKKKFSSFFLGLSLSDGLASGDLEFSVEEFVDEVLVLVEVGKLSSEFFELSEGHFLEDVVGNSGRIVLLCDFFNVSNNEGDIVLDFMGIESDQPGFYDVGVGVAEDLLDIEIGVIGGRELLNTVAVSINSAQLAFKAKSFLLIEF